jgi:hypothetical protein
MIKKSKKILGLMLVAGAVVFMGGASSEVGAQIRDPFAQPAWSKPRTSNPTPGNPSGSPSVKPAKPTPPPVLPVAAPPVQDRINYYMQLRQTAAANNQPIPKPISVLTMDELTVTGIFKTSRGYAATVQANPINLYYTLYPGEKLFDGQLVAIEENRLVFRKVTKMSNGKFVASEQSKMMQQYTEQEKIQGTAPIENSGRTESANNSAPTQTVPSGDPNVKPATPGVIISPVDEMNRQMMTEAPKSAKEKKSATKKPVKVAKNKDQ